MKKQLFYAVLCYLLSTAGLIAQTNPVAEYYPEGYPAWTDQIQWNNVINMKTNPTVQAVTGEWARYEKGIELLGANGGVLYYPAGTYVFSDIPAGTDGAAPQGEGIMLRSGVVIMGEKPAAPEVASTVVGGALTLATKFEFPLYDRSIQTTSELTEIKQLPGYWNFVGLKARAGQTVKDVNNIGVCFIQFKYGGLYWGAEFAWATSYSDATAMAYGNSGVLAINGWMKTRVPDGTHYQDPFGGCAKLTTADAQNGTDYKGVGSGRLIMACRFDEAVLMDAGGYVQTAKKNGYTNANETFTGLALDSYRFAGRITVDAKDVFIASNAITKPATLPFIYKTWSFTPSAAPFVAAMQGRVYKFPALFDPAKQIGIDVGKSIVGLININQRQELKEGAPFYEPNMIVRDNYVYNHGNKGYEVSGKWVKIINNVNDRDYLTNGLPPTFTTGATTATVSTIGDAEAVYGITTAIPYQIGTSTAVPPVIANVAGVAGHYLPRLSNWGATNATSDNMSRAYDLGGQNVWIDNNSYWRTGSLTGNDGEGILYQRSGQIECISTAITNNKMLNKGGSSKSGYVGLYDVHVLGGLILNNTGAVSGYTAGVNKPVSNWISEFAVINNQNLFTSVNADSDPRLVTGGNAATNIHAPIFSTSDYPATPTILAPTGVKAIAGVGYTEISWNPDYTISGADTIDNSQEIGYRVERRIGNGPWSIVAYRPMQSGRKPNKEISGAGRKATYNGATTWTIAQFDPNPPAWRDYEKPATGSFEYRVVALGATEIQNVVQSGGTITKVPVNKVNQAMETIQNPAKDQVFFNQVAEKVTVYNLQGAIVHADKNVNQVSLKNFPKGIYMLNIQVGNSTERVKVVKN